MKSTNILFPSLVLGIAGGFVFSGCVEQKQSPTAEIDTLKKIRPSICKRERNSVVQNQHQLCLPETCLGQGLRFSAHRLGDTEGSFRTTVRCSGSRGICGDPDKRFYPELSYGCEGTVRGRHAQRHESGRCSGLV